MKIASLPLLAACGALAFAGCGSGDDDSNGSSGGGSSSSSDAPDTQQSSGAGTSIDMKNIQFDPKEQTVKVGEKVTWVNQDDVDHNVVTTEGVDDFESKNFGKGGTYSYTATKAGKIEYTCTLHPGMDGELTVTG